MLKALKAWRERAHDRHDTARPARRSQDSVAEERPRPITLLAATRSKDDFLAAVEAMLAAAVGLDALYKEIDRYFARHASPALLVEWGWELIPGSGQIEPDDTILSLIERSMAEAGMHIATLVAEGNVTTNRQRPLAHRLAQAEWSIRRGGQTLFLDEDETTAAYRPPDGLALPAPTAMAGH